MYPSISQEVETMHEKEIEKLHSEYYGEISDYTRKCGVICSEILLPPHAPPEYVDRETLWNAVEKAERGKKAQLAYSFDIALQNEFSMQENIALARQFLLENFVSCGMVVDFAVHSPDKEDGGISNPHFHVMCPIRPIEPDGRWGNKQRREYVLDEHGERVLDEAGNHVFNAVPTTDWGSPETLEAWRQAWADLCNTKFAEKGSDCRIDHRSLARQGVEQIPTQHEGPTVRAMEAKGIRTDKGDLNRWIRKTNAMLREAKQKIAALIGWLKDVKAELDKPQPSTLNDLLALHCANRNKGAYSNKAKNANLQRYAEAFSFLQSKNLYTVDNLENTLHAMQDKIDTLKKSASSKQARIKEVDEPLRIIRKNPFKFKLSDVVPKDAYVRDALTKEQQEKYLQFVQDCGGNYYDDIVILLGTGLRVSELYGLTRADIDFDRRCIHVRRQLCRTAEKPYFVTPPKTKSGIRNVPMTDAVYMALMRVVKARTAPKVELLVDGHSGFLFLDKSGMPKVAMHLENYMRGLQARFEKAYGKPVPRITPHVLRHTFCTNVQQAGLDVKSLQYLMGHSNASVTLDVYTHSSFDSVERAFEQIASSL